MGAVALHPATVTAGAVEDSVTMYPVAPTLSVAVKVVMGTVSKVEVAGIAKVLTAGVVVSATASVMVTVALLLVDTFPAASLAQA